MKQEHAPTRGSSHGSGASSPAEQAKIAQNMKRVDEQPTEHSRGEGFALSSVAAGLSGNAGR